MEQEMNDECKVGLGLGIGVGHVENRRRPPIQFHILFPPCPPPHNNIKQEEEDDDRVGFNKNGKRSKSSVDELEEYLEESVVQERVGASDARKKLRLNKDQTSVLEEAYQVNNTLTGMQKQELAEKLNLRPRQVEVWFQNRRARNKLKQTEVDFEMLKKWCDSLNNENRRLRKELQELKLIKQLESSTKVSSMALAAMTVCPSCMQTATSNTKMEADEDSSMAC